MNMNKILEDFIARYFEKKLMPRIRATVKRLMEKHGRKTDTAAFGRDYYVNCFGFQTSFMMRYMLMAFAAVCGLLLIVAVAVNRGALEGVKIFGTFFVLCLILWLICKMQSGFIVYSPEWLYVERSGKQMDFSWSSLKKISVTKNLTLIFGGADRAGDVKVVIPLEGTQYMDFMKFMEKNCSRAVQEIPKEVYEKAMRRHAASWGNRL